MTNPSSPRIPMPIKVAYTAFMAVLVPFYWHNYGPTNFLFFCDVALFLTLIGVWKEKAIWIGMPAAGIVLPQMLWVVDFASNFTGTPMSGLTDYMFNDANPLFNRGLSLFHGWLPFFLLWLITRVGYDRRSFAAWVGIAWTLIVTCYLFMPGPTPSAASSNVPVNINYVYGFDATQAQDWMPELAWLGLWMLAQPLVLAGPTHLLLRRFAPHPRSSG